MSRAVLSSGRTSATGSPTCSPSSTPSAPGCAASSASTRPRPGAASTSRTFLNAVVVAVDPDLDARGWLDRAHRARGRRATAPARCAGGRAPSTSTSSAATTSVSPDPELTLPHPRAHERAFVLVPWCDVEPDATLTVATRTRPIRDWLADLDRG